MPGLAALTLHLQTKEQLGLAQVEENVGVSKPGPRATTVGSSSIFEYKKRSQAIIVDLP